MAKTSNVDIFGKLRDLGLSEKQQKIFCKYVHEKHWKKAISIYKKLQITRKSLDTEDKIYLLLRESNKSYDVNLEVVSKDLISFCNCSHRDNDLGCEHVGAVLIYKMLSEKKNDFNSKLDISEKVEKKKSDLGYFGSLFPKVVLEDRRYMIYFNFEEFESDRQLLSVERGVITKDGKYGFPTKFRAKDFTSGKWEISRNVQKVLNFMNGGDNYGMKYSSSGLSKSIFYDINTDLMMPVLRDIYLEEPEIILGASFSRDNFKIVWNIDKTEKNTYILEPFFVVGKKKTSLLKMKLFEIGSNSLWVYDLNKRRFFGYPDEKNLGVVRSVIRFPKKLELSESELVEFFSKYYQKILDDFEFNVSSELRRESRSIVPKPKLYLEKSGAGVRFKLKFDYDGREVDYFSTTKEIVMIENNVIYDISRDLEQEEEVVDLLNSNSVVMHENRDEFILDSDLIDFVSNDIPKLVSLGINVLGEDKLFNFKVVKKKPKMKLEIESSSDWFDLKGSVSFGDESVDIKTVMEAIFNNKRFVELSEGSRAIIPNSWIHSLQTYSGFFELTSNDARLSKYHASIVEAMINLSSTHSMDEVAKKVITKFRDLDKVSSTPLSSKVNAKLRPYQKVGYDWLCFLRDYGFNGILADDMGLGKTLQTLSLFQKIKDEKKSGTLLVIVPTSLVFNWNCEIEKFAPNLSCYLHHGSGRIKSKSKFEKVFNDTDVIITTYGILRNDLELFTSKTFEYVVLDEAHLIKNPLSVSAKSVCQLSSKGKLVISGTPIQNNLTELWSLFHFLNPGYLGSYDFFRETFVVPIEKGHDEVASDSLRKLINPFLLRRTKQIISSELPEKTEMIMTSSFSSEETEIYNNWKEYYKTEIKTAIKEKGIAQSKMKILEGLMKLRQICLHPKMIDTNYFGSSSKFELLMMEVEKVLSEGHKVLIFSSFVKMLSIVKDEFEKRGLIYSYLDGQTKNREKIVSNFQNSLKAQAFLISIKAGGLGLNLTSADYVFIVDPWWNPAVELQAMDRAHRIGQDKNVFVYKMITQDTIEEKILELQKSKKKLVDDLITEDNGVLKSINVKDIEKIFG